MKVVEFFHHFGAAFHAEQKNEAENDVAHDKQQPSGAEKLNVARLAESSQWV
jgi:hypothetical protein